MKNIQSTLIKLLLVLGVVITINIPLVLVS
jgi:hypothetical protein